MLPILNQLQKALCTKVRDLGDVCDRNRQTVDFILTMAKVKKVRRTAMPTLTTEKSDDEYEEMDQDAIEEEMGGLQSKWSDDDD